MKERGKSQYLYHKRNALSFAAIHVFVLLANENCELFPIIVKEKEVVTSNIFLSSPI